MINSGFYLYRIRRKWPYPIIDLGGYFLPLLNIDTKKYPVLGIDIDIESCITDLLIFSYILILICCSDRIKSTVLPVQ